MKRARQLHIALVSLLIAVIGISACNDDVWDEVPGQITSFLAQYFPSQGVSSYTEDDNSYYVKIRNGAALRFNTNYDWTEIDGGGNVIPEDLVYDQFPDELYRYLESVDQQDQVYKVIRNRRVYDVTLLNSLINYDIATRTVTYSADDQQ